MPILFEVLIISKYSSRDDVVSKNRVYLHLELGGDENRELTLNTLCLTNRFVIPGEKY